MLKGNAAKQQKWSLELYEDGRGVSPYERWLRRQDTYTQLVVDSAIRNVLMRLGMDICENGWGKSLSRGLFEFRIDSSLNAINRHAGLVDPNTSLSPDDNDRRILVRVFVTFYGQKVVLFLHGYNKLKNDSGRKQNEEIEKARGMLAEWKRNQKGR